MQILPARAVLRLRRARRRLLGLQEPARRTSSRAGRTHETQYSTIQTGRVRLYEKYHFLRVGRNIVYRLWLLTTEMAGTAGSGLFDDRVGPALRGRGELLGEQEIQVNGHLDIASARCRKSTRSFSRTG